MSSLIFSLRKTAVCSQCNLESELPSFDPAINPGFDFKETSKEIASDTHCTEAADRDEEGDPDFKGFSKTIEPALDSEARPVHGSETVIDSKEIPEDIDPMLDFEAIPNVKEPASDLAGIIKKKDELS